MSFHFKELIQCPECGENTSELYHQSFTKYGEEVLMCGACYEEKEDNDYEN